MAEPEIVEAEVETDPLVLAQMELGTLEQDLMKVRALEQRAAFLRGWITRDQGKNPDGSTR